jgi:hypothetical protein
MIIHLAAERTRQICPEYKLVVKNIQRQLKLLTVFILSLGEMFVLSGVASKSYGGTFNR